MESSSFECIQIGPNNVSKFLKIHDTKKRVEDTQFFCNLTITYFNLFHGIKLKLQSHKWVC